VDARERACSRASSTPRRPLRRSHEAIALASKTGGWPVAGSCIAAGEALHGAKNGTPGGCRRLRSAPNQWHRPGRAGSGIGIARALSRRHRRGSAVLGPLAPMADGGLDQPPCCDHHRHSETADPIRALKHMGLGSIIKQPTTAGADGHATRSARGRCFDRQDPLGHRPACSHHGELQKRSQPLWPLALGYCRWESKS